MFSSQRKSARDYAYPISRDVNSRVRLESCSENDIRSGGSGAVILPVSATLNGTSSCSRTGWDVKPWEGGETSGPHHPPPPPPAAPAHPPAGQALSLLLPPTS
jgi:hypothetical protein